MAADNPFGVLAFLNWHHAWNDWHFDPPTLKKAVEQLRELGVGWVRTDILWSDVYRENAPPDFSQYEPVIDLIRSNGIRVLALLHYNKEKEAVGGDPIWNRPPASIDEFAEYVHAAVSRFKDRIRHWEIWNEPNHPEYWSAPPDGLRLYSRLLTASHAAAKAADPGCTVLNGGITLDIPEGVRNLYQHAGKNAFDVLSVHPFLDPADASVESKFEALLRDLRSIMRENGDAGKKIWITEIGCPGLPDGAPEQAWFAGKAMYEGEQADWLRTIYGWRDENPDVEKVFWAFYRDTRGMFPDATNHFGLVRFDLSPKPAFYALKELIAKRQTATRKRAG